MNKMYQNNIDGLCVHGNDDCVKCLPGIFSCDGLHPWPPAPTSNNRAPYLPYMKVNLGDGKSLTIRADKVSDKNRYVQSVTLNGEPIKTAYLTHNQIMARRGTKLDGSQTEQKKADFHARTAPSLLADTGANKQLIRSVRIRSKFL